jgi:uncharacterized lipoprotein YajG
MIRLRSVTLLVALLLLAGCSRGMSVGSPEPTRTYSISVTNQTNVALVVSYNDGRADAILGSVSAGATERFVIAGSTSPTVTVRGTAAGGRTSGPYTVTLTPGITQTVILR